VELIKRLKEEKEGKDPSEMSEAEKVTYLHGKLEMLVKSLDQKINEKNMLLVNSQQQLQ
jgi:predicted transcriptional regulator